MFISLNITEIEGIKYIKLEDAKKFMDIQEGPFTLKIRNYEALVVEGNDE